MLWGKIVILPRSDQHLACKANNKLKMNDNLACAVGRRIFLGHNKFPESLYTWPEINLRHTRPQTLILTTLSRLFLAKSLLLTPLLLAYSKICTSVVETETQQQNSLTVIIILNLSRNAFWEVRVQLVGDTSHAGNNKTIYKSLARQKSQPKTSLALFSYVQTNQFAPYCLLEASSRCAELGRDVIHHPPDGLSDCARSSVLWATSAHLSLNDVPGTLQTVEIAKLGSY